MTLRWRACRPASGDERLAGAFQDFFRFEFHARHTVGLGDVPRLDEEPAVVAAIDRAGAGDVVARLASGLETQLGPTWPGGVELSFGQWQKLALARGFMRDQPLLLVLDEPTAALDAETEHALFERYAAAARGAGESGSGRITILVSHRFSTVRMADLIVVLDGARLVEVGTHDELMAKRRSIFRAVQHPGRRVPLSTPIRKLARASPARTAGARQFLNKILKIARRFAVNRDALSRARMNKLKMRGVKSNAINELL